MKRIEFTTNNSVGYIELPDNVKSIKIPAGVTVQSDTIEPLMPTQFPDEAEETTKPYIPQAGVPKPGEEEPMLPNVE
jgi:hypothetical protein